MKFFSLLFSILFFGLALFLSACDPIGKLAKKGTIADKDSAAMRYMAKGKYQEAAFLLEELASYYRGTPRHREIYHQYCWSKFKTGELVMAAYYFSDFARQYPRDEKIEEARFMEAKAYYMLSDPWYLDQTYTKKGIETMQLFLDAYPFTSYKDEASGFITDLRERLARKGFEQAHLYLKLGYFKAGLTSFSSFINEFPDSKYRERAQFLLFKSAGMLTMNTLPTKKTDRFTETKAYYEKFVDRFPGSKFAKEAESLLESVSRHMDKHKKSAQTSTINNS